MITRQKNGVSKSRWARISPIWAEESKETSNAQKPSTERSSPKEIVKQIKKDRNVRRVPNSVTNQNVVPPPRKTSSHFSDFIAEIPRQQMAPSPSSVVSEEPVVSADTRTILNVPEIDLTPAVRYSDYLFEALRQPHLVPPISYFGLPFVPPIPSLGIPTVPSVSRQPSPKKDKDAKVTVEILPPVLPKKPISPKMQQFLPQTTVRAPMAPKQPVKVAVAPQKTVKAAVAPVVQEQQPQTQERQEVFRYTSDLPLYSTAWSSKSNVVRFAVGSMADRKNKITVVQLDEEKKKLVEKAKIDHEFAINHMQFVPDVGNVLPELLAVSSSTLSLYNIGNNTVTPINCNDSENKSCYDGITSFHWNEVDPKIIGSGHLDGICTIFDIEVRKMICTTKSPFRPKSQLVAHDSAVHDIEFSALYGGKNHFATVGMDGTCRGFDMRSMDTSTVLYADRQKRPLMRISWSRRDAFHFATFAQNSNEVSICDIRVPGKSVFDLDNHSQVVNGIAWAPHNPRNLCTVGDDGRALIWDLDSVRKTAAGIGRTTPMFHPESEYSVSDQIAQVSWSTGNPHWISIVHEEAVDILWI